MTLLDHKMYRKMKPREFLDQNWLKKNKDELSPNVIEVKKKEGGGREKG